MCTELRQSLAARFGLDQIDISLTQVAVAFPVSSSPLFRMLVLRASDPIIIRGRPLFPAGVNIHVGLSPRTVSRVFKVNQSSRLASLPLANQTKNWSSGPSGLHDDSLNTSGCWLSIFFFFSVSRQSICLDVFFFFGWIVLTFHFQSDSVYKSKGWYSAEGIDEEEL